MSNSTQGPTLEHLQKVRNICNLESAFNICYSKAVCPARVHLSCLDQGLIGD